jgi:UDP-N-acetylmuramoyl-L-alanyl-D-glutamate--2,6-diaminopimelate ligase
MGMAVARSIKGYCGIAADSRNVRTGFLFAALPGTKTNGARFIADAVDRGAVAVLGAPEAAAEARSHGVAFVSDNNPRQRLSLMAAEFFADQPLHIAAVTGTNGKTSIVSFLRQIWTQLGHKAASLGTLGVDAPSGHVSLRHTTPDPVELHMQLARLSQEGVKHLALEASSHGLDQFRLDGARIAAAGFTNITRDHLDYHSDFEHYFSAKMRLFGELLGEGGLAVVNADAPHADEVVSIAARRAAQVLTVGKKGDAIKLLARTPYESGQKIHLRHENRDYTIDLPLVGEFQISNAFIAAGLAIGLGAPAERVFASLETLKGTPGRMELVAYAASGAPIYVDYAHTPDAMQTVLDALRPHVKNQLIIVFGCGGERDSGKRPLMGAVACNSADVSILTDDNPRGEDPAAIRREAMEGCPSAIEVADRRAAIQVGIEMLSPGDALILGGKGHEEGQIVGTEILPFSERKEAIRIALALGGRAAQDMRL